MDLTTIATATPPNSITTTSTPDTENETPPTAIQPNKSLSFTNGFAVKKNSPHHHRQPPQPLAAVVIYKECLKNHAASLGGHAVDGCGEFMVSPTANPTDPSSLKCAACGCHRNFHRRDDDPITTTTTHFIDFHLHPPLPPPPLQSSPLSSPSPPPPQPSYYSSAPHMLLALSTAVAEDHPTMNNHPVVTPTTPTAAKAENPNGRKRFRTRFSQEQKEKMFSFSEKLGWKMHKSDERLVEEFCNEAGVGKGVLKVWMHNNKHTLGKINNAAGAINHHSNSNGKVLNFDGNSSSITTTNNSRHHNESNNGVHLHVSTNGSPPSA